jgi:hypothetical protein
MSVRKIGIITNPIPLFSSGLTQNSYFLYDVLTRSGFACELLSYSSSHKLEFGDLVVKQITTNHHEFDYSSYKMIITVAKGITKEMYEICKIHKIVVVGFVCGNILPMNMISFISESSKAVVTKSQPVDQLWIIEAFSYMKTYVELMRGSPSRCVPHLWSSKLLEHAALEKFKQNPIAMKFVPKNGSKINILIMEPNLDIVKTALIPTMAAEKLNFLYPELIDQVYIFNFPEKSPAATAIINNLTIRPKIRIFKSQHIAAVMLHFNKLSSMPIFVSHQILTPWNYLYYELMYFGYPLVHNSPAFKEHNYFYNEYNIDECASEIKRAFDSHNTIYSEQKRHNAEYLDSINPESEACINYWSSLISKTDRC